MFLIKSYASGVSKYLDEYERSLKACDNKCALPEHSIIDQPGSASDLGNNDLCVFAKRLTIS